MKKVIVLLFALMVLAVTLNSCKSTENCEAYKQKSTYQGN